MEYIVFYKNYGVTRTIGLFTSRERAVETAADVARECIEDCDRAEVWIEVQKDE